MVRRQFGRGGVDFERWNRRVVLALVLFVPLYLIVRFTGGSLEKLGQLPDLIDRFRNPISWEVPEGGVRYTSSFAGEAREGHRFVLVRVRMQARLNIAYPIVPRCFTLVDDRGSHYFPLTRSPLFKARSDSFHLGRDEGFDEELLFEVPLERDSRNLLFEPHQN
jgi:hypothetical protein